MHSSPYLLFVLTIALLCAAYVRHSVYDAHDPHKCSAALNTGHWLDPPTTTRPVSTSFSKWQPAGCTTKSFAEGSAERCLGSETERENVFIGDSTLREVFWGMARILNRKAAEEANSKAEKHADISFSKGATTIKFIWDPLLNSSHIATHISRIRSKAQETGGTPNNGLVVLGAGLWFTRDTRRPVEYFKDTMDTITDSLPLPDPESKGVHRPLILPVQPPYYDSLDQDHRKYMAPEVIDPMNDYMLDLSMSHDIDMPAAFLRMFEDLPATAYEPTGRHLVHGISDKQAELLLNIKCNDDQKGYPYNGTCCLEYEMDWIQFAIWVLGAILTVIVAWVEVQVWTGAGVPDFLERVEQRLPTLRPILVVWACLCYCYLTDRTHILEKVSKLYNAQDFWVFCAAIAVAGLASIRRSGSSLKPKPEKLQAAVQPFLSRDQTDEWKGWMQALILAYHYTGGSKVLWIYKIVRLLVASYLFMSGYGHAAYFYQRSDYSLKRVVAVLIRLNLLSVLLPWMMQSDYLYYYFAPLVSYWYLVIYLTFRIQSDWNQSLAFLICKIAVAAVCTTLLHLQHWLFDPPIRLINLVFGSQWDAREWLFRVSLDQYIVYIGMLVAVLYIRSARYPSTSQSSLFPTTQSRPSAYAPHLKRFAYLAASAAALALYHVLAGTRTTKAASNDWHTYISPLPILAFVYLRNCTRALRNHHAAAFAWLGRISLETFILQYHLWLAADTKGLLSLGIFGDGGMSPGFGVPGLAVLGPGMGAARWADCVLLGVVFVWVSLKVGGATAAITGAVVRGLFQ